MTRSEFSARASALLVAACIACEPPALVHGAGAVDVAKGDPPPGAKNLGPIEVASGEGCGVRGSMGSSEGAEAELRKRTEERGGDYVQVTKIVGPHVEGGCYDERFVIRGVVFRVKPAPVPAVAGAVPAGGGEGCVPACSPGYACDAGTCRAQCNPACAPDQACEQDRTCRATVRR